MPKQKQKKIEVLSVVNTAEPSHKILYTVDKKVKKKNQTLRALRPISLQDFQNFLAIFRGENLVQGFRNKDIQKALYQSHTDKPKEKKKSYVCLFTLSGTGHPKNE